MGTSTDKHELVILLHGLARTSRSMQKLEKTLLKVGYKVLNINYPSTSYLIEELSEKFIYPQIAQIMDQYRKVHFVTHSMGGIIARYLLKNNTFKNIGNVVMLGPPNHGSEIVDFFYEWKLFRLLNGPAGLQLGTKNNEFLNQLGKGQFKLGVITGTKSLNPFYSMMLPGVNDGKVSVESSKLSWMSDYLELPVTHTFMMKNFVVIENVLSFL